MSVVELADETTSCSCAGDDSMPTPAAKANDAAADSGDVPVPSGPDEMWEEAPTGTVSSPQAMTTPDFWLPQLSPLPTTDPGVRALSPTASALQAASQIPASTSTAATAAPVLAISMAALSPAAAVTSSAAPPASSPLRMRPAPEVTSSIVAVAHAAADAPAGSTSDAQVAAGLSTASAPSAGAGVVSAAEALFLGAQKRACSVAFQVQLPAQ